MNKQQRKSVKTTSAFQSPIQHKQTQTAYYDEEIDPEFETSRPHGTPRFYQQLMQEKFLRSVSALGTLTGKSALTVCGGSGTDAEFLANQGARVIASDLSPGATRRAQTRFTRYLSSSLPAGRGVGVEAAPIPLSQRGKGLGIGGSRREWGWGEENSPSPRIGRGVGVRVDLAVADIEHLPFPDRSIDLVYVHDGLHHLADPAVGIREMARVSNWAISITEPANARLTAIAVKLGRAEEIEEAGNRVARLDLTEVTALLKSEGFEIVHAERYFMYYKHKPGPVIRFLSLPVINHLAWTAWRLSNGLLHPLGNKLTIQAIRSPQTANRAEHFEPSRRPS